MASGEWLESYEHIPAKSHQRSWWIVHIRPTKKPNRNHRLNSSPAPPRGREAAREMNWGEASRVRASRPDLNNPPTPLVGFRQPVAPSSLATSH